MSDKAVPAKPKRVAKPRAHKPAATTQAVAVQEVQGELASNVPVAGHPAGHPANRADAPIAQLSGWRAGISQMLMRNVSQEVDGFGLDPLFSMRVAPALEALFSKYWRVQVHGLENIPSEGRVMLVGNHSGGVPYDGLMLMHAVRRLHTRHRLPRLLVEDDFFTLPFVGPALARLGCVRANPDNAERLLRDEQILAVFPEGTKGLGKPFSERYRLQRFGRGGFVKLACRAATPILPVAIVGAEEVHPLLARIPLPWGSQVPFVPLTPTFPWLGPLGLLPVPTRWSILIGPPVDLGVRTRSETPDPARVVELTERVRSTIQRMLDDALAARASVLFG